MKKTRIDIFARIAALPALILLMSLAGCGLVFDEDENRTSADGMATLILHIATSREGTASLSGGSSTPSPVAKNTRGVTVNTGDYNKPQAGELMRTLRVIIANGAGQVEHNIFFDNLAGEINDGNGIDQVKTTDQVKVIGNDRKTIYLIANEGAITLEGDEPDASKLLGSFTTGTDIDEAAMKSLVLMADKHKADWNDDTKRLLPITNIEYFDVGKPYEEPYTANLYVHRAAVKFTFLFNNETNLPLSLDSILLIGDSDREFLFPNADGYTDYDKPDNMYRPTVYHTPAGTNFRQAREKMGFDIPSKQPGFRVPRSLYFTEGSRLLGTHIQGKETIEDVYKVAVVINGVRTPWRKLDWFYPENPTEMKEMTDLPRNTHVVVQFTLTPRGLSAVACVQPYAEQKVAPFFGLARDKDGNLIRKYEDDGTFWADNPRYPDKDPDNPLIWEDIDGDQILKQFKDGSLLCLETMYRDWIHDETEVDHAYVFEKNQPGGNMVIIRQKTPTDTSSDPLDTKPGHEHGVDDRPLFVKFTLAFLQRNGISQDSIPVGTHVRCIYDDNGKVSFSRRDKDGDLILQANGFQFRNSPEMGKWMDTYLVEHVKEDGSKVLKVKDRDGNVLVDDFNEKTATDFKRE